MSLEWVPVTVVALSLAAALAALVTCTRDVTATLRTTATQQQQETARIARYIPKIAIGKLMLRALHMTLSMC